MSIYSGRVDTIVDQARLMMNDTGSSTYLTGDTQCLAWINRLVRELATTGLWSTTANLDLTADTGTIDLSTELSDYVSLAGLWWDDTEERIPNIDSMTRYQALIKDLPTGDKTLGYHLSGTTVYLIPVPTANDTNALLCQYYYLPDALDGTVIYTPEWPEAYDDMAINFCVWQAYLRERTTPNNLADYYRSLFERGRFRLFAAMKPALQMRCYR